MNRALSPELRAGVLHAGGLEAAPPRAFALGCEAVDESFSVGGVAAGAHQIAGEAAWGFALVLAARALSEKPDARALLVQTAEAARERGAPYAPGLKALGLDPDRLALAAVRTEAEALRVLDEALRSGAVAVVAAELQAAPHLDLSVTRRFNLAARRTGAAALIAAPDLSATSAALSRWRAEPGPSRDARRRLGRPAFRLDLIRNRLGPTGAWSLEWDRDDRRFRPVPPLSASLARPAVDRPDPARAPVADGRAALRPYRQAG